MRNEKLHPAVARSTFPTQKACSDHFWKFGCPKNGTPVWREAHFQLKMYKTHHVRTSFGSSDVEKCTFPTQNVQNTPCSEDVKKMVRGCGAKHMSNSKCTKHTMFGPVLEVRMSKNGTPLWRKAHFRCRQKVQSTPCSDQFWKFGCRKKKHAAVVRSAFPTQNVQNTPCSDQFWTFGCGKNSRHSGAKHISKLDVENMSLSHF